MNIFLLHPTDTLFFRDGRPMSGSLTGHGAAWPLPTVINHAFHAALHRAGATFDETHVHRRGRSGDYTDTRDRKFGSLVSAGPFPVCTNGAAHTWFFPRPLDAGKPDSTEVTLQPLSTHPYPSSLPSPLQYAAANTQPPNKETPNAWWSEGAWNTYLGSRQRDNLSARIFFKSDADFADTEHTIGIGISADTGTQNEEQFYSAHYLRLRDGWRLGSLAEALDKVDGDSTTKRDLLEILFPNSDTRTPVIVGGQQRLCTVERHNSEKLPFPVGAEINGTRVKWVLLTPAIFPQIGEHKGGWLPSWIDHESGRVMLLDGPGKNFAERHKVAVGKSIAARLVAAVTGKPVPVTGYALPNTVDPDRTEGGSKSAHLAVPAGSVYYFEAETSGAAQVLAAALNWHGAGDTTTIRNRRSTLFGEKGFGLGVCGNWECLPASQTPD